MKPSKYFWRTLHLWLGLTSGLIFFTECLSGVCMVFEEELKELIHPKRFHVDEQETAISLDSLSSSVLQAFPKEKISAIKTYADPTRTIEFSLAASSGKAIDLLYVNPYTGAIADAIDSKEPDSFAWALKIHQTLLLDQWGKTILGLSSLCLFFILVSGIILWWPKSAKILKQRLKIKKGASAKRLNHDLHIVLGFYCAWFLLISVLTSLPWSFSWANDALYTLTRSKPMERSKNLPDPETAETTPLILSLQQALLLAKQQFPTAPYWAISLPNKKQPLFQVSSASTYPLHRNGFDNLSIALSGKILKTSRFEDSPGGWQLRRYMKPIHSGSIGGIWTKSIAFLVCLISASFPVTGLLLWLNRRKKKLR